MDTVMGERWESPVQRQPKKPKRERRPGTGTALLAGLGYGLAVFFLEASVGGVVSTFSPTKLLAMGVMGLAWLATLNRPVVGRLPKSFGWWFAYAAWMTICALFAFAPLSSLGRVLQLLIPLVLVADFVRRGLDAMWLVWGTLVASAAHVLYGVTRGQLVGFEGQQRLVGLVIANTFALTCALTIVISTGLWQTRSLPRGLRWVPFALMGLGAYGVYLSVGRTAALAIPVALVAAGMFVSRRAETDEQRRAGGRRFILLLGVLAGGAWVATSSGAVQSWFSTGNTSLGTLTGRTDLWSIIWNDLVPESPFVGYGPGAMRFPSPEVATEMGRLIELSSAHNSFFEALLSGGYLGGLLWLVAMAATAKQVYLMRGPRRPLAAAMCALVLVNWITIPNMSGFGIGWYALLATLALASSEGLRDPHGLVAKRLRSSSRAGT